MTIAVGERLPEATLMQMGPKGPEDVALGRLLAGRKVVIFAVPAPFSTTCDQTHLPSFIRVMDGLKAKGVDAVICIAVTDPFAMRAWGEASGANAAGIQMLTDPDCSFTTNIGLTLNVPAAGLIGRSQRYSMLVDDGKVTQLNLEEKGGVCELTAGEAMLDSL